MYINLVYCYYFIRLGKNDRGFDDLRKILAQMIQVLMNLLFSAINFLAHSLSENFADLRKVRETYANQPTIGNL